MSDPDGVKKYLDEQLSVKGEEIRREADKEHAQMRVSGERSRAAMAVLAQSIVPYLEETKRALSGQQLIVEQKITADHQVAGVAFRIQNPRDETIRSSTYEIEVGTAAPLIRMHRQTNQSGSSDDLAERVGVREFEDLNRDAVERLVRIAIDEYVDNAARK